MIQNYLVVAWRHILKNKLYASINILGLMVGLSVFIFGILLVRYETGHDSFWKNADRIYTAGTVFSPEAAANIGVRLTDGIYYGFGPKVVADVPEMEAVARTIRSEFLISVDPDEYYQSVIFADPALLEIFDLQYIHGDNQVLNDPSSILLTRSAAIKFFGTTDVMGRTMTLDHDNALFVRAVVEDLPASTHFNSSLMTEGQFEVIAPVSAFVRITEFQVDDDYGNLSMGNLTYLMPPASKDMAWVQNQMDGVFQAHYPDLNEGFITELQVRPVSEVNTILQDAIGMPILDSIRVLGFLVLVVAIVNYTNLATAQSMSRAREVGLRKTMGAARSQLLAQFLVESLCIVAIAILFALALLELMIPLFNEALDRQISIAYADMLPFIVITTVTVGIVSGLYPAYLITRASPIDALAEGKHKTGGGLFRSLMLGLQFTISIFMLAMVMIVFFQNKKVEDASNLYPRSQILTLQRLNIDSIQERFETLRRELKAIPGVEQVSFSSQLPYQQSSSQFGVSTTRGDDSNQQLIMSVLIDDHFLATYDIPLLAGRNLGREVAADILAPEGSTEANVIVNELLLETLGFGSPESALGAQFWDNPDSREPRAYNIVGVVPDQNFQGFHNQIKPMIFQHQPTGMQYGSVRISGGVAMNQTLQQIEGVWDELITDYPIQTEFLDETFADTFKVYNAMTKALGGFATVALTLSMIGLFGLAAFMAQSRTREIGIRKVMGASIPQIVRLLVWQFSRPVMWALLIALPLAYFASNTYLNFFAERINVQGAIVLLAGILAVLFSWTIVALHAMRVARANPVLALRYE